MATWNGSCPDDRSQNYSSVAPEYPECNIQSYSTNWAPMPMQQAQYDSLGQHDALYADPLHHTNFYMPPPTPDINLNQHPQYMNICNPYLNTNNLGSMSTPAVSSVLTPDAGEFIPRQNSLPYNNQTVKYNNIDAPVTFRDNDQKYNFKRNGKFESKRGYMSRKQVPPQRTQVFSSRQYRGNFHNNSSSNVQYPDASSLEEMKTKDRAKLLAETAAFLGANRDERSNTDKSVSDPKPQIQKRDLHASSAPRDLYRWDSSMNSNLQINLNQKKKKDNSQFNTGGTQIQRNFTNYKSDASGNGNRRIMDQQSRYFNPNNQKRDYKSGTSNFYTPKKNTREQVKEKDDDSNRREWLAEQLTRGILECLVCCERVRQSDFIWSCSNCYHNFHLRCIKKWANSSKAELGWLCPACRNIAAEVPQNYYCFCGKVRDPEWNRVDTAHSCGQMCGLSLPSKQPDCTHRCTLLCHPGPCPSCTALVKRNCGCGKKTETVKCSSDQPIVCGAECGKKLNCGIHYCKNVCHMGKCSECQEKILQVCHCQKVTKEVPCTSDNINEKNFSCGQDCDKLLSCGNHRCNLKCHSGPCCECELTPDKITHCPCGQTPLKEDQKRVSCTEPIPVCDLICSKKLSCGQANSPHTCQLGCHTGPCPPCPLTTNIKCVCGSTTIEVLCKDLPSLGDGPRCEKKCTKKRSCGKHKCNQLCCTDKNHNCPLPCNHLLSCGQHRCEECCHRGRCPACWRMSFDELFCECGSSVLYPPIPCGTRPPECSKPCSRPHSCDHPALHNCHSQATCPPCTMFTQKYCHGKHEIRKNIPCHQDEFSCGLPCNEKLSCGRHNCILPCHKGPCLKEGQSCTQPCTTPRSLCGHICAAPCHNGPCPDTPCKEMVKVTCECGHRSMSRPCADNAKEYQQIATSLLATKLADMQLGLSVDIQDIVRIPPAQRINLKVLECNEECRIIERNRRLAIGLQIRNPDISAKLTPRYSDFMKQWAKKDSHFCNMVHEKLTELVQLAQQSKQKSRSYSFDSMNRDKRHFIHEYCEHFGCESAAYDKEPKRNVVATASKDKAWLPALSLLEVVQRESGQRKIPKPVINTNHTLLERSVDILPVKYSHVLSTASADKGSETAPSVNSKQTEPEEEIDYFDFT